MREPRHVTHGLGKHPLYRIHSDIKTRCYNKNSTAYHYYGGRGIIMCHDWLNDFKSFYDWAMANGYKRGLTIDRKDNDGSYSPSNCRWLTMKEQCRNRRSNIFITYKGETKIKSEWAIQYGIKQKSFDSRIKRGWTMEETLTTPMRKVGGRHSKKTIPCQ